MGSISSGIYSIRQFLRNPKRSFAIMAGIIISITLVSGIFIAGESLTNFSIQTGLDDVKFDYILTMPQSNESDRENVLNAFENVKDDYDDLEILKSIYTTSTRAFLNYTGGKQQANLLPESITTQRGFAINQNDSLPEEDDFLSQVTITAMDDILFNDTVFDEIISFDKDSYNGLNSGEILLDVTTANELGISIGDQINLHSFWESANFTVNNVTVVGTFEILELRNFVKAFYPDDFIVENERFNSLLEALYFASGVDRTFIMANVDYGRETIANLSNNESSIYIDTIEYRFLILLAHDNLPIYDIEEMYTYFDAIKNRLILEIGTSSGINIEDNIFEMIEQIENQLTLFEAFSLIISIPTLMTGLFLTITLYDLTLELRRREFGIIKSRGATSRQSTGLFLVETMFIGVIGGLIGSFTGLGISYGIISKILGESYSDFLLSQPMSISWEIILGSIIGAFILILISIIKPIKKYSEMSVVDTTAHYQEEEAMEPLKSKTEWFALVLGLLPILLLLFNDSTAPQSARGLSAVFINLLELFGEALIWLSPFLLTYAIVKIVAGRSIPRLSKISQKIAAIFSKTTSSLVARSITRNPKRSTRLVFIISITICFGLTSLIVTNSQEQYEFELAYLQVGADLNIQTNTEIDHGFNETIANYSSDIQLISNVATTYASLLGGSSTRLSVNGIDPSTLLEVSKLDKDYFNGEDPGKILQEIVTTENGLLLSKTWAEQQFFNLNESIPIAFSSSGSESGIEVIEFKIVGFVDLLPGISKLTTSARSQDVFVNFQYLNMTILENLTTVSYKFLVDIIDSPVENATTIGNNLDNAYIGEIQSVKILEEIYLDIQGNQGAFVSAIDMMAFQFPFLLIISTLGILVISYLTILEKRREMALMRVRGVRRDSLIKMQFSEGLVLIILGTLIGSLGFFIGWVMNLQLDSIDRIAIYLNLSRPYSIPWDMVFLQNSLIFIIFTLTIIGISFWETRNSNIGKVAEILRNA